MDAPLAKDESARLDALRKYRILDTPSERDFDDLVKLAAQICHTPVSLVSLVDKDRQWFKGRYGLDLCETPRRLSFCSHTILQAPQTMEVRDTTSDPRFADNELVTEGPQIRYYAGAPLVTPEGYALGTLCVIDTKPRQLSEEQKEALRILSQQVMMQLELRRRMAELAAVHERERDRQEALVRERTSELASANEALRRSETWFRTLAEASFEGIVFHENGRIVDSNEQFAAILGCTREELVGKSLLEFLPPEEHENAMQGARENREAELNVHLWHREAGWRTVEVHGRPLKGEHRLRVATVRDITERKRAEEALRSSEERFRTLANAMPQLAWIVHADGSVSWYNQRWYEYTGTTPEQMKDCGWHQVHDPKVLPKVLERWHASLAAGQPFDMELSLRRADGQFRPFLTRVMPLKDAAGNVVCWFGTNTDISDIVAARETLARSREELERLVQERTAQLVEANANLQNFCHTAAHDFRSPLRAITNFSSIALEQYGAQLDSMGRSMLERVLQAAEQITNLLNDLLEYSKMGQARLRLERVNLESVVRDALALLEQEIQTKNARVTVNSPLLDTMAHPATVVVVVNNLVSNVSGWQRACFTTLCGRD